MANSIKNDHNIGNVFSCGTVRALLHVHMCRGRFQISRMAETNGIKFSTVIWTGYKVGVQESVGIYLARAHVQGAGSRSQERLGRLRSYLVHR